MYVIPFITWDVTLLRCLFVAIMIPHWDVLIVSVSTSHAVGSGFMPWPGHTKGLPAWHAGIWVDFDSASRLYKRRDIVCGNVYIWGHELLKISWDQE